MFCGKCGAQNLEDAAFCKECGEPFNGVEHLTAASASAQTQYTGEKRNRTIGIVALAIVAVIVVSIAAALFGGRSYKTATNKFIKASFEADGKVMLSLMPDKVVKYVCEEEDMTKNEAIEYLTDELEDSLSYYDRNFNEWSYSYRIVETENCTKNELKLLNENYKDEFGISVKAAKTVTVEITIAADEGTEASSSLDIALIKVGSSWYVDVPHMGGLF